MSRTPLVIALLALALLTTAGAAFAGGGGGGGGGGSLCAGFHDGGEVVMRDNCFEGTAHFTGADGTVRIKNGGRLPHTYTAVDGAFDTGLLEPGQSAEVIAEPGIHRVVCKLHADISGAGMAGVLIVGDLDEVALTAAPASARPSGAWMAGATLLLLAVGAGVTARWRRRPREAAVSSA